MYKAVSFSMLSGSQPCQKLLDYDTQVILTCFQVICVIWTWQRAQSQHLFSFPVRLVQTWNTAQEWRGRKFLANFILLLVIQMPAKCTAIYIRYLFSSAYWQVLLMMSCSLNAFLVICGLGISFCTTPVFLSAGRVSQWRNPGRAM